MDGLRIHQKFIDIREHKHSSITGPLVSAEEKIICAAETKGHLWSDESLGGNFDIISGSTTLLEIRSGSCIASKRKHDDMSPLGLEIGDDHNPTSTQVRRPRLRFLVGDNAAYKPQGISDKIHGSWLDQLSKKLIPEACGDSDLTAEPYMAESSKSSCFDDACTLALDSGTTAAESDTLNIRRLRHESPDTKTKVSDLNYPVQISLHEEHGNQIGEQSKNSTEKLNSYCEKHVLNQTEDFRQVTNRNLHTPETMASASEECSMAGIDSKSWLQLGLGIGAKKPHLINSTAEALQNFESNKLRDYAGIKKDQDKLIHDLIFPFHSKHSLVKNDLQSAFSSIHWPHAAGSGSGNEADQTNLPLTRFSTSGSNLDKASTDTAHETICPGEGERNLDFLIGHKTSPVASHGDSASNTTGLPRAYMHQAGDQSSHTLNNLSLFLQPAACDDNMGFVRANPTQQAYQLPVPDGRMRSSDQLLAEHLQLRRSMNSRSVGLQLHSLQNRPGNPPGQNDKVVTATGEGGIQKQQIILSQEWQQVAKRIGTNMHFQSILPGGTVPIGNTSPFQFTIEDLNQLTAILQQANYATQISSRPWISGKLDFQVPLGNPLVHPAIVAGYLPTSSNVPINHIMTRSQLLPHNESGASLNNPVSEQTSLVPPWHTSIGGSYGPKSQRIAARNTISAEKLKLTSCTKGQPGLWFMLQASDNPSRPMDFTLPPIPKGYLRVKDEKVPVSYVKKYLARKLGVACESEVEITCKGQLLDSSLSLQCVRDTIWFQHANNEGTSDRGESKICNVAPIDVFSFSNGAIMVLTYQRKVSPISVEMK